MTKLFEHLSLDNSFAKLDPVFFTPVKPEPLAQSQLIHCNPSAGQLLGLNSQDLLSDEFYQVFSGNQPSTHMAPLAMIYSGHQFGVYNPQLGDGRGLLLGEALHNNQRWDIHLKGAGKTPYSRFGDGRAVLRSSIREYLGGEALHGLGIDSTRSLALFGSNEPVYRETVETGASLIRLAQTHIRFGHFEYFHYTGQPERVKQLADYVLHRHYPDIESNDDAYEQLLLNTVTSTAKMIAGWQSVGFTHGVMNTDNMSILGETFDYGPFGFMDNYQSNFVCNHSDEQGRYAFNQQPGIGLWNLNALAHALSSLLNEDQIKTALKQYQPSLTHHYAKNMREKLGLASSRNTDLELVTDWISLLEDNQMDFTNSFRALCHFNDKAQRTALRDQLVDREKFDHWAQRYADRLQLEQQPVEDRQAAMKQSNPKFILRNHLAQQAIESAQQQDYSGIDQLLTLLQSPFEEHADTPNIKNYCQAPPADQQGLSLSCSS